MHPDQIQDHFGMRGAGIRSFPLASKALGQLESLAPGEGWLWLVQAEAWDVPSQLVGCGSAHSLGLELEMEGLRLAHC